MKALDEIKTRLSNELAELEKELKIELPKEIGKALEMGDLRENAEYKAALERQEFVMSRYIVFFGHTESLGTVLQQPGPGIIYQHAAPVKYDGFNLTHCASPKPNSSAAFVPQDDTKVQFGYQPLFPPLRLLPLVFDVMLFGIYNQIRFLEGNKWSRF